MRGAALVTMIAPSPAWFAGPHGFDLSPNGDWVDNVTLDLSASDAGTDQGVSHTSRSSNITPHVPIARVTQISGPLVGAPGSDGEFLGGSVIGVRAGSAQSGASASAPIGITIPPPRIVLTDGVTPSIGD